MWELLGWFVVSLATLGVGTSLWWWVEDVHRPKLRHLALVPVYTVLVFGPGVYAATSGDNFRRFAGALSSYGVCMALCFALLFYSAYQNWRGSSNLPATKGNNG